MAFTDDLKLITPQLSEIKTGTPAIKIGSHYLVGGIGGDFIPAGQGGSGGGTNFYKCTSVDTSNSTWSGKLATISDSTGIWHFSSDSTSLVYDRFIPNINSVYAVKEGKCDYQVTKYNDGIPIRDLVFYLPLSSASTNAVTGQSLTTSGTVNFLSHMGVPCAYFDNSYINCGTTGFDAILGDSAKTVSLFMKSTGTYSGSWVQRWAIAMGPWTAGSCLGIGITSETQSENFIYATQYGGDLTSEADQALVWHHICYSVSQGSNATVKLYIDGQLQGEGTISSHSLSLSYPCCIGYNTYTYESFKGYVAAVRIYSRVLTSSQISQLASQFTPTVS